MANEEKKAATPAATKAAAPAGGTVQQMLAQGNNAGTAPAATAAKPKVEKAPGEKVKMSDGREVEFPAKTRLLKQPLLDGTPGVRMDFRNGATREFRIPAALAAQFAAHGASQKLGDAVAGLKDDKGQPVDVEDMVLEVDELIEQLMAGEWSSKREGDSMAGTSVLLKALVEVMGKSPEDAKAFLKGKSQAEKLALRMHPKVKPVVQRIEDEKAQKGPKVDTDALLKGLADFKAPATA